MASIDAPRGKIPVLGETWRPVGRKAFVAALWLAPIAKVRPLVPPELPILPVLPGRTLASAFLGDYGPGSTLEYHELGVNPALVLAGGLPAIWNHTLVVDSEAARIGGELAGAPKVLRSFAWEEEKRAGRASGSCRIGDLLEIRYAQGRLPLPPLPVRAATLRDELLLVSWQHFRGRTRLGKVRFSPPPGSPLAWLAELGEPLVGAVVTGMRGRLLDHLRVASLLPHRARRQELPGIPVASPRNDSHASRKEGQTTDEARQAQAQQGPLQHPR